MGRRKGQMIFEFMIAAVLFFGIVLYILSYLSASMTSFSNDFYANTLHSKALAAAELLVANPGNWSGGVPVSLGLSDSYPVLNGTKVSYLSSYCQSNYQDVQDKLNLMETNPLIGIPRSLNVMLEINQTDGTSRMQCGSPPGGAVFAQSRRVALSDDTVPRLLVVSVSVW